MTIHSMPAVLWKEIQLQKCKGKQTKLLYLPTQMRFPIGGERVTRRELKLTNSLGKQQHELSTCTWSGHASWDRGKFVSQQA